LSGIPRPVRMLDSDQPPPHEPDQYCVYHHSMGHQTEFCTDLRRIFSKETDDTTTSNPLTGKGPKGPERPEPSTRPQNVNVITRLDLDIDPLIMIRPIDEPQPEPNLVNIRPRTIDHQSMADMVMDLNPDDTYGLFRKL
jgi:hypothetical protein